MESSAIDIAQAQRRTEEYDPEMSFRTVTGGTRHLVFWVLVCLSFYHYITAGYGILAEHWHKAIHLGVVLFLIFMVYGFRKEPAGATPRTGWARLGNVPLIDWVLGISGIAAALYIPMTFDTIVHRLGQPNTLDVVVGTVLIITIFEATRRTLGPVLPLIVLVFILYGLFGRDVPIQLLKHPGASWPEFINHVFLTSEGIYGIPVKVVSTFVFHFVLFGVIATRMGLGQFFLEIAQCIAGRYAGGPAKVSVISSAFFGTISGSSIANTVTTGALTIPAMKRAGYSGQFAGAVEAASSAGGQVTPPIMGAAAFIMVEFTELPYTTIIIAATVPALMHYLGVLTIVHLEARRLGLKGMSRDEIPALLPVLRQGWPTLIPLVALLGVLFNGYTPYQAAFWGITSCIVVGLLNPMNRITLRDVIDAFYLGAKYALVVGAAAAIVGIIIGVVTMSGAAFRISFLITQAAQDVGLMVMSILGFLPPSILTLDGITLFFSMVFIALVCIIMGAGISTTTLYIILVTVAAPALTQLGVPLLAAHLFVLYYGVLAEITPPVCTSAYAAGAIAGANPFRTGLTAFRLGNAKALVPFVFATSPAMLIVLDDYFTWYEFIHTTLSCAAGVMLLGASLAGYLFRPIPMLSRIILAITSLMMVAPGIQSTIIGASIATVIVFIEYLRKDQLKQSNTTMNTKH